MTNTTTTQLNEMRLAAMATSWLEQQQDANYADLSFDERFSLIVQSQYTQKQNNQIQSALRAAKLKQKNATAETIDYEAKRNISKQQVLSLLNCSWIHNHQNLIITGPTGVGKSFLASAIAHTACLKKIKCLYLKTALLAQEMKIAEQETTLQKLFNRFQRFDLIIFDEWLRESLSTQDARNILDLIDERYTLKSQIFISQIPVDSWINNIEDPTMAEAILDRVVHNAHRLNMQGESMRAKHKIN